MDAVLTLAFLLIAFNITMWIVFAFRFKKIFSTDDIMRRTRDELNSLLTEMNRNAERNVSLINERIKELRAVSAEAEREITKLRGELKKVEAETRRSFQSKVEEANHAARKSRPPKKGTEEAQSEFLFDKDKDKSERPRSGARIDSFYAANAVRKSGDSAPGAEEQALAASVPSDNFEVPEPDERVHYIPILEPRIFADERQSSPREDFYAQVRSLADLGFDAEKISEKLGRTVSEVKLALEFS
ncbi:MAG: hypothetical protein J1F14_01810 [Treponema sp.]|nr:hypothetical protein [Treponema sp.]